MIAGDLKEFTIKGRNLEIKATSDIPVNLGGKKVADDDSNVTNQGTMLIVKTNKLWKISVDVALTDGVVEFLEELVEGSEETIIATFADGSSRSGTGIPVGDIEPNFQSGIVPVVFMGSGKFELI
jgi:hypothetical protein